MYFRHRPQSPIGTRRRPTVTNYKCLELRLYGEQTGFAAKRANALNAGEHGRSHTKGIVMQFIQAFNHGRDFTNPMQKIFPQTPIEKNTKLFFAGGDAVRTRVEFKGKFAAVDGGD